MIRGRCFRWLQASLLEPEYRKYSFYTSYTQIQYFHEVEAQYPALAQRLIKAEQLEHESWLLGSQMAETTDPKQKKGLEKQLRSVLATVFDIRVEEKNVEVIELGKELGELEQAIEKRRSLKQDIITRRIESIVQESDDVTSWW